MRPVMGLDLQAGSGGERATRIEPSALLTDEQLCAATTAMTASSFELLDVRRVADELMSSALSARDLKAERVLVDTAEMRLTIVALKRSGTIGDHVSARSAILAPIFGRARFASGNGIVDLTPGRFMFVGRGTRHEIAADEDTALMLVSLERTKDGAVPAGISAARAQSAAPRSFP